MKQITLHNRKKINKINFLYWLLYSVSTEIFWKKKKWKKDMKKAG